MFLGDEIDQRDSGSRADAVNIHQLGIGLTVAIAGGGECPAQRIKIAVASGQEARCGLADMADAEGKDQALKRYISPRGNGRK